MTADNDKQRESVELPASDEFPELFHYTSISALRGILQSKSLWATRATHMNDSTETELIWPRISPIVIDYYRKELERLMRRDPAARNFINRNGGIAQIAKSDGSNVVEILRSQLLGDAVETPRAPIFVVSFSTHSRRNDNDDYHQKHGMLSQWRGYCSDDGVAIVFDTGGLEDLLRVENDRFHYWPFTLTDVVYDIEGLKLENRFPDLFGAFETFVRSFIETKGNARSPEELGTNELIGETGGTFARLKHVAFHEERECRIIAGVTPKSITSEATADQQAAKAFKSIHHRSGQFGSIPYVRLFEGCGQNLPINRVIVGPSRNQQAHLETVTGLTRAKGIEVTASETPFVGSIPA